MGSSPHTWRILIYICFELSSYGIISTYVENTEKYDRRGKRHWDHLHIRGEYGDIGRYYMVATGSSPHTWRILIYICFELSSYGIISTYVENTEKYDRRGKRHWDHLHIRGEYGDIGRYYMVATGSSPHTWRIPTN